MSHFRMINGMRYFNYEKTLEFLEERGKQMFGKEFEIHKDDIPVIDKLIVYAAHITDHCPKHDIDLNKGLLLTGPIGCGKTSWMHLIRLLAHPDEQFMVKSTREIAFEFNKDGYEVINLYGKRNKRICFDDIGVEQNIKFYGNECNTMAEILLHRYEMQTQYGILTHATTNLSASQLENVYGNRVRSRLRSMFNLVSFPASSQDKRK
jgi:DNA replication protein DnaC